MTQIRTSVRSLVEFILRCGDIDNRRTSPSKDAMLEGGRIHRAIQRRMGPEYHAEVPLNHIIRTPEYDIVLDGRADGIILEALPDTVVKCEGITMTSEEDGAKYALIEVEMPEVPEETLLAETQNEALPAEVPEEAGRAAFPKDFLKVTIDEIKGTYKDVSRMKDADPIHLAQAKCYAYIFALQNGLPSIRVRMTYCHMETQELRYFHYDYTFAEISEWFEEVISEYKKWADYEFHWKKTRQESIRKTEFPFPYRKGQKDLVTYVYRTVYHRRKLFIEAPTGVGKTMATVFPAIRAMGEDLSSRIFYLTAKTITREAPEHALSVLREQGLSFKSVTLTAKDKICFQDETECNPKACPFAKGHFDRVNDAIYDILTHEVNFDRETILRYSVKYQVCPFEFGLDIALFADMVICDYNYLFDPHAYLRRFFTEGVREDYIFLIDEAHNLVERGREMYSAELYKEDFLAMKRSMKEHSIKITHALESCNRELLMLKRLHSEDKDPLCPWEDSDIASFVRKVLHLYSLIEDFLDEHEDSPVQKELLEFYFKLSHFLLIHDSLDEHYVIYTEHTEDLRFKIRLFNVNPSKNLKDCMLRGRSSILFSATLLPIDYFKKLLGAEEGDYEVYAESVFSPEKRGMYIAKDVTSKYTRRGYDEFRRIAEYIRQISSVRPGNYMVFFPSFAFLKEVSGIYREEFGEEGLLIQSPSMKEKEREEFLRAFQGTDEDDSGTEPAVRTEYGSLIGMCVLGGIFSEGIDLKNDSLIGALIVGTGIPLVCNERELLKKYFDEDGVSGYDYAYKFPGMNKVMQAAGRVIRTEEDTGVVALLDERFLQTGYLKLFPREWSNYSIVGLDSVSGRVEEFWNNFGNLLTPDTEVTSPSCKNDRVVIVDNLVDKGDKTTKIKPI